MISSHTLNRKLPATKRQAAMMKKPCLQHLGPIVIGLAMAAIVSVPAIRAVKAEKIANDIAVFAGLDKITARITSFEVPVGETAQFGALRVTPNVCYSRPLTETPLTSAFVAVDEVLLNDEIKRIFTGWMFASSPGLHAVEHPVFDIWLTNCKMSQGEESGDSE